MKSYPFSAATYQVPQLADELVAAGVPMGGAAWIDRNAYPYATSITIWANDDAVDATVNATVSAHVPAIIPVTLTLLQAHEADTTGVHGIADAADLIVEGDSRLDDARTPTAHSHPQSEVTNLVSDLAGKAAASHTHAQADVTNLVSDLAGKAAASHVHAAADVTSGQFAIERLASGTPTGAKFVRDDGVLAVPAGGGGSAAFTAFVRDLGAARRSGTFDLTGLSGLTADKFVLVRQTAAPIASKGNARDEIEFDAIQATGYVLDATTIRVHWHAPGVCVGDYALAYLVSA